MTPAEAFEAANAFLAEARDRFDEGDHTAVGSLCVLAQGHFAAAASGLAMEYARAAMGPIPQPEATTQPEPTTEPVAPGGDG